MSIIEDYFVEGDFDNMFIALEAAFRGIKNKFKYPASSMMSSNAEPAKYVHKCDRDPECKCISLISYLL